MTSLRVPLPDRMEEWVRDGARSGGFASEADYVRDLIRQDHNRIERLRSALIEGEQSGLAEDFDFETFVARKKGAPAG